VKQVFNKLIEAGRRRLRQSAARRRPADISFFHEFSPPPGGGGHQFLRALWNEMERSGLVLENNTLSAVTKTCLCNSFNFDFDWVRKIRRPQCRLVHRVDGPIGVYRGYDDSTDGLIWRFNRELADATILQSEFSLRKHVELGFDFVDPVVIPNAVDPTLFHGDGRIPFPRAGKIRLISASWSDNPNKGAEIYRWLDGSLDWERYEYVFVGRSPVTFSNIRIVPPLASRELADLFRRSDIFITGSRNDPCSNALLEALSCGLPALYLNSGGHSEIAGEGGVAFDTAEEIPSLLAKLVEEYERVQSRIRLPAIEDVARRYLEVLMRGVS